MLRQKLHVYPLCVSVQGLTFVAGIIHYVLRNPSRFILPGAV